MSNQPPMIRNIEEVIDRMGLSDKITSANFSALGISNMVPADFIDPEVCLKFGIETMEDLMEFMESVEYEDEEDDGTTAFQLMPVESKVDIKDISSISDICLAVNQQRGRFWCNRDLKFVSIESCIACTTFFGGYNKITCVLTCNYKFSM